MGNKHVKARYLKLSTCRSWGSGGSGHYIFLANSNLHGSHQIQVAQFIYEMIVLSLPQKKVHPGIENGSLKSEIVEKLEALRPKKNFKEKTDPRWDKLKDLL